MQPKSQNPLWPYLGVLACLSILSLAAPRAWEREFQAIAITEAAPQFESSNLLDSHNYYAFYSEPSESEPDESTEPATDLSISEPIAESDPVDSPAYELADTWLVPPAPERAPDEPLNLPVEIAPVGPQLVAPLEAYTREVRIEPEVDTQPASPPAELASPADPPREPAPLPATPSGEGWPVPQALVAQLNTLAQQRAARWPAEALPLIEQLCQSKEHRAERLHELSKLVVRAETQSVTDEATKSRLARARLGLNRWVQIWESAIKLDTLEPLQVVTSSMQDAFAVCLANVNVSLGRGASADGWREYLLLPELTKLSHDSDARAAERRARASQVLNRLESPKLNSQQRKFLASPALVQLQNGLREWAAKPVSSTELLVHLDNYEQSGLPAQGRLVADDFLALRWSSAADAVDASARLEEHYRNANLRVAVALPLTNRMLPQVEKVQAPVSDRILNVPTYGCSTTFTNLKVRFVPDAGRVRIGLEASGLVASNTVSTSGPATFHNQGQSTFMVRKLLLLSPQGFAVFPAAAEAKNDFSYLTSVETDFDDVPLVGKVVQKIARNKHNEARGQARVEVEQKVATRAREQLDAEVGPRIEKAAEKFQNEQLATLTRLGLDLLPVEYRTTDDRIAGRFRLSGTAQLGSHTPRPAAPSDSWLSIQLHETAINNALEQLDLAGRQFTVPELFAWIGDKVGRNIAADNDDLPEDLVVTFAKQDPVRVRCADGVVEIILSIARLKDRSSPAWHDFEVHADYVPQTDRLSAPFSRENTISIKGVSGVQAGLRSIFSKVLAKKNEPHFFDDFITSDPRFADLEITQFVVDDGWIGLAYSPHRSPKHANTVSESTKR